MSRENAKNIKNKTQALFLPMEDAMSAETNDTGPLTAQQIDIKKQQEEAKGRRGKKRDEMEEEEIEYEEERRSERDEDTEERDDRKEEEEEGDEEETEEEQWMWKTSYQNVGRSIETTNILLEKARQEKRNLVFVAEAWEGKKGARTIQVGYKIFSKPGSQLVLYI